MYALAHGSINAPTLTRSLRPRNTIRAVDGETQTRSWATVACALALFVLSLAVYWLVHAPDEYNRSDPLLIVPTSLSLLHDGDLDLSEYAAEVDPEFYGITFVDGHSYNRYPIGTSLLVLPIVWVADRVLPPAPTPLTHVRDIAAVAAKILAALSVALLFVVLRALRATLGVAVALALVFAFATVHFPLHAGGLFTHNAVIPLVLVSLLLLVHRDGRHAAWSALPLAAAFATRPTSAPIIGGMALWVALRRPDAWPRFALVAATLGVAFVAWSIAVYGTPLPPYYWSYDHTSPYVMSASRFVQGLVGHLVSPNRGLFVFSPILVFALWGMVAAFRSDVPHAALHRMLALSVVVHWLMISIMARKWWAGWSFGPRHLAEVVPLLVVLVLPAADAYRAASVPVRRAVAPLAAVALFWSVFVAAHGATSTLPQAWNSSPSNVDEHPERVWDWRDMQLMRGIG